MSATATAIQTDAVWLRPGNYNVAAFNAKLAGRLSELKVALQGGIAASPDISRENFYDVELPSGWAYIYVRPLRDNNHIVYLVAYSRL